MDVDGKSVGIYVLFVVLVVDSLKVGNNFMFWLFECEFELVIVFDVCIMGVDFVGLKEFLLVFY